METKICKRCGKELPITEFYQVPSMKANRDNTCKNCRRELKGRIRTPDILHCPVCGKDLPYYRFLIARKSKTGRMWCCKDCFQNRPAKSLNNFRKDYDKNFRNSIYKEKREERLKHFKHYMFTAAKRRAEKKGMEFNITEDDITIPEKCPILDIPFQFGTKDSYDYSPSLDRIDTTKGYVKGNIWVISKKANTMKSNATWNELTKFATNILRYSPSNSKEETVELEDKEPQG